MYSPFNLLPSCNHCANIFEKTRAQKKNKTYKKCESCVHGSNFKGLCRTCLFHSNNWSHPVCIQCKTECMYEFNSI